MSKKKPSMTKPIQSALAASVAASAIAAWSTPVSAQTRAETADQIIVTARKREERLVDTPIAVTAVSDALISSRNFKDLSNISQIVPNLVLDAGTGSTGGSANGQVFIRGIGQQDFLFSSDPGVGLYVDGVYFPRATGVVMDLVDIERIEVLRGPQGTLFGKNTIGGAITVTSKKPTNELEGSIEAGTGSRDRLDVKGAISVPLIEDVLAVRLSGSLRKQDGYVSRINAGDDTGEVDSLFGRLQARWTPSESFTVDLSVDQTSKRESSIAAELIDVRPLDPSNALLGLWNALVAPTYGPGVQMDTRFLSPEFVSQGTGPNFSNFDMFGASLTMEKDFSDNFSIKSVTAYREQDSNFADDTDHSPLTYTESINDNQHDAISQEIQFTGKSDDSRFNWVLGGFYMHEKGRDFFDVWLGSGIFNALEALPGAVIPLAPGATCPPPGPPQPCVGGAGNPFNIGLDLDILITDRIKIDSYAVFGEASYDLTDAFGVTVGLRYSIDEKDFTTSLFRKNAGIETVPPTTVSDDWDNLSPRFVARYKFAQNSMIYGSVTGGFKSGGFNGRATSIAEIDSFDPEKVWAYEVGAKTVLFDNRLSLNLAGFYNDYSDMQIFSVRDVQGLIVVVTENAAKVDIKGFEAELAFTPSDNFNLRGSVGYLDAQYDELAPTATVTLDHRLVKTPKWTISGSFDYGFDIGAGRVTIGSGFYHRSSYANELANEPILSDDGYTLADAFLRYNFPGETWSLTAYGTNLGDVRYKTNGLSSFGSFGNAVANFGPPREWGVKLRADF